MTIFIAIVGLGLLIFVHELGHFLASLALRMRPRKFYIGFPPAIVKHTRNGIEYGIGMIPLGGFVKIPGMHRPAPGDVDPVFGRAVEEAAGARGGRPIACGSRSTPATTTRRATRSPPSRSWPRSGRSREHAAHGVEKGVTDLGDALGPDAYWRARTWKRVLVIFAGPGGEHPLRDRPLHRALHDLGRQGDDHGRRRSRRVGAPLRSASLAGDRIVSIDGVADDRYASSRERSRSRTASR